MAARIKRKEQLKELQKQLLELNNEIQKAIDGESSMGDLAEYFGLTPQRLNTEINNGLYPLLRKVKILNNEDIEQLLKDSGSPSEKLMYDILKMEKDKVLILDIAEEEIILDIIAEALTEKETVVIGLRYGFNGEETKSLKYIADLFGMRSESIRQIEEKALNKLRNPKYFRRFLPNNSLNMETMEEQEPIKGLKEDIEEKGTSTLNMQNFDIIELGLSTRTYNALRRVGVETLEQLSRFTVYDLMHIHNLGKKSIDEIIQQLQLYGIELDNGNNINVISGIKEFESITHSLKRMGVYTVDHLSRIPTSQLINLGQYNAMLIYNTMLNKFNIKLVDDADINTKEKERNAR